MTDQHRSPEEQARITHTLIKVCTNKHELVMYHARRDQPEKGCPVCGKIGVQVGEETAPKAAQE